MPETSFDYKKAVFENVPCSLCGGNVFSVLSSFSANGRRAKTCLCRQCGLIFINPRMTGEWYDIYYRDYYRGDREFAHGYRDPAGIPEKNFSSARRFGFALGKKLEKFLKGGLTIDVGSSTGGTLYGLKKAVPELEIFGIEPSLEESEYANAKGIKTYRGLFENYAPENPEHDASNIFCVRSLNHLLDPRKFFEWARESLCDGGHLILYVKNFRYQARRAGSVSAGVQIDHPYMFTPESLENFVKSVGFKVVYLEDDEKKTQTEIENQKKEGLSAHHILLVAKKDSDNKKKSKDLRDKKNYFRTVFQLSQPFLKLYYLFTYSKRTKFLRKLL